MSAIKNNFDSDFFPDIRSFDQGESFGRYAERQELLPLLKAIRALLRFDADPSTIIRAGMRGSALRDVEALVADIERPPAPPVTTTPTDEESVNF
jgi:hypothetical protein